MLRRILLGCLLFGIFAPLWGSAHAQTELQLEPTRVTYTLGGEIRLETALPPEAPVNEVWVFIHPQGNPGTIAGAATLHPSNQISYSLDLAAHPIPAYTTVEFWYQLTLSDEQVVTTAPETFVYADNRFAWQTLGAAPFEAAWYEGDVAFGQAVLNAAAAGAARLQTFVPAPLPDHLNIFVYASAAELQTALRLTGQSGGWVAGHARPELGMVVVSLPPGPAQDYEIARQIPHEVAHVMLYEWLGEPYYNLPQWLREGLPSMTERFPNPDYALLLDHAVKNDSLLPMAGLCERFPLDASNFLLAYAQSADFSWFLYEQYGSSGLEALARAYANGIGCEQATEAALGKSLGALERDWRRAAFGENPLLLVLGELLPWLLILGVVLLGPLLLSLRPRRGGI